MTTESSSSKLWTTEEEYLLEELIDTCTNDEIALMIEQRAAKNVPGFNSGRTAESIRKKKARTAVTKVTKATVQERIDNIREIQKEYKAQSVERNTGLISRKALARKILSLSDIHVPFCRYDLIKSIIEEHSDADICVVNGDLLEGYIYSTFDKAQRVAALSEYRGAFELVRLLSEKFPQVYLVNGNHDARVSRTLKATGFEKEHTQVLRPDLLARIANGELLDDTGFLVEKLDFKNVFYEQRESWYVKIGKTLFVHPWGKGSSKPGFTAQHVNQYFASRYNSDEYDSVVVGHTHKLYKGVINSKLLIEQGCLADLLSYSHEPSLKFIDNGFNGYAVIYQDKDGNTSFNHSGFVYLGEVLPPKKSALE
jgi:predicted phosphodiesterase